jgi:hypothetical protein
MNRDAGSAEGYRAPRDFSDAEIIALLREIRDLLAVRDDVSEQPLTTPRFDLMPEKGARHVA